MAMSPAILDREFAKFEEVSGDTAVRVTGGVEITPQPGVDLGDVTVNNGGGVFSVNVQDGGNVLSVDSPDTTAAGSFTASGQNVDINTVGRAVVTMLVTGTFNMFVTFFGSVDGVTFTAIEGFPIIGGDSKTFILVPSTVVLPCAGLKVVRITSAFYSSGTATISLNASSAKAFHAPNGLIRSVAPTSIGVPISFTGQTVQFPGLSQFGQTQVEQFKTTLATWGKCFNVSTGELSTGGTGIRAAVLIDNPSGSGILMRISRMYLSSPQAGTINYHLFLNPTTTANGTLLTEIGARQTGQTTGLVNIYSLPTVSANGTVFFFGKCHNGGSGIDYNHGDAMILEAGNKILVAFEQSAAGSAGGFTMQYEETVS